MISKNLDFRFFMLNLTFRSFLDIAQNVKF